MINRQQLLSFTDSLYFDPGEARLPEPPRQRLARYSEIGSLVCLIILASLLPFAGITIFREIGMLLGLLFWLAHMTFSNNWKLARTPLDIPLMVLLLIALLSLLSAVNPKYSLHEIRGEMLRGILLFYFAVNNLRTSRRAAALIYSMLAAALVMDGYGIIFFLTQGGSLLQPVVRLESLHSNPAEFWTYLIQTAPFLIAGGILIKDKWQRLLFLLVLMGHTLCIYMTFSRLAMIILIVEIGLCFLIIGTSWKKILISIVLVTALWVIVSPRQFIQTQIQTQTQKEGRSYAQLIPPGVQDRFYLWSHAWEHMKEKPFSGLGFGRSSLKYRFPDIDNKDENLWHSHNTFLTLAVGLGIQGLLVFVFILARIILHLWPANKKKEHFKGYSVPARILILGTLVMLFGYFMNNMVNDLYVNDAALLFWLMVGCSFSLKHFEHPEIR